MKQRRMTKERRGNIETDDRNGRWSFRLFRYTTIRGCTGQFKENISVRGKVNVLPDLEKATIEQRG